MSVSSFTAPKFYPMLTFLIILGLASVVGLVFLATAVLTAPDGYQDSEGYHISQTSDTP